MHKRHWEARFSLRITRPILDCQTLFVGREPGGNSYATAGWSNSCPSSREVESHPNPVTVPGRGMALDAVDLPNHHKQQHIAARSKHPGGVNASRCDGSVDFILDTVELAIWDEMCSAASGKPLPIN